MQVQRGSGADHEEPMKISNIQPQDGYRQTGRQFQGKCFQCGKVGHTKRNCMQNKKGGKESKCYWCGKAGHLANKCPARMAGKPKMRVNQIVEDDQELQWDDMTEEQIDELVAQEEAETVNSIEQVFLSGGL